MKKIIFVFLTILSFTAFAQIEAPSKISGVKVFMQNAEITRSLSVNLSAGSNEVVLTGLSTAIIPSSLQVLMNGESSALLSAKYQQNYLQPKTNSPEVIKLQKRLEEITDEFGWIVDQKYVLRGMEDIMNKNQVLGGATKGFTPVQVIELANSYKAKLTEIRKETNALVKKERKLNEEKSKIQSQLNDMNALAYKPSGNIVLHIDSKGAEKIKIKCSYNVNNAGWVPLYDLRSKGIEEDVVLNYKANVWQQTGIDWDNVPITISTGNPMQNSNRPVMTPLYAYIYQPKVDRGRQSKALAEADVSNFAYDYNNGEMSNGYLYNANVNTNQMNIEFEVDSKQIVKCDGKQNLMGLKSYTLPTEYAYHAVPKLNKSAFLLAKVSDWGQYNLLAGEANIFFEDAYIGKSNINPNVAADTLLISMGRDNGITIQRKPIKEYTEKNFIGTKKEESFGYEILVLNKKSIPIEIEILDQIPVSQNELIEVKLEEKGSAKYSKSIGKLFWELTVAPGQTVKERFAYSVKYPEKENVVGIK